MDPAMAMSRMKLWWNWMIVLELPKNEVLGCAEGLLPVLGLTWLATAGPLITVTVLFANLAEGPYGRSVLKQMHSDENMKIMRTHLRLFIRLDLSIGCHHCYGRSGSLESIQLS